MVIPQSRERQGGEQKYVMFIILLCACAFVHKPWCRCGGQKRTSGIGSFFLSCGLWGWNLSSQVWWQKPFAAKLSQWPNWEMLTRTTLITSSFSTHPPHLYLSQPENTSQGVFRSFITAIKTMVS